jgi:hypothetical protein
VIRPATFSSAVTTKRNEKFAGQTSTDKPGLKDQFLYGYKYCPACKKGAAADNQEMWHNFFVNCRKNFSYIKSVFTQTQ